MWADILSKIGGFGKGLILLGERLDQQAEGIRDIRKDIKTLSSAAVGLHNEIKRLENELRILAEREAYERKLAEQQNELFKLQIRLALQEKSRETDLGDQQKLTE